MGMRKPNFWELLEALAGLATIANLVAEAWKNWNEAEAARLKRRLDEKLGGG